MEEVPAGEAEETGVDVDKILKNYDLEGKELDAGAFDLGEYEDVLKEAGVADEKGDDHQGDQGDDNQGGGQGDNQSDDHQGDNQGNDHQGDNQSDGHQNAEEDGESGIVDADQSNDDDQSGSNADQSNDNNNDTSIPDQPNANPVNETTPSNDTTQSFVCLPH